MTLSGSAEMGVAENDEGSTSFFQSVDVRFSLRGATDNGLSFGATVDLEDAVDTADDGNDLSGSRGFSDYTVFIGGDWGTLTLGDVDGALDAAVPELDFGGAIADDHTSHAGFSGNGGFDSLEDVSDFSDISPADVGIGLDGLYDGQVLQYRNTFGGARVFLSVEAQDEDLDLGEGVIADGSVVLGLGAQYSANGLTVGGGLQFANIDVTAGTETETIEAQAYAIGATYEIGAVTVGANLGRTEFDAAGETLSLDHIGVGAAYTMDAITLAANWGEKTLGLTGAEDVTASGYGVSATYDLGGGASAQFGYGDSDVPGTDADYSTWSIGIRMNF